jgi:hypothetical protein
VRLACRLPMTENALKMTPLKNGDEYGKKFGFLFSASEKN